MRLWEYLKREMLKNFEQKVCEESAEMTYEELVIFAEMFAKKLQQEKCCAILCSSEMASSMALLCCFAAGVTAVPLSFRYGKVHCNKILDKIKPTAIISDSNGELQVIHLRNSEYVVPNFPPALIMCTSGTTGTPKGVMLTEKNIMTNVKDICSYLKIAREDCILIARPIYHCAVLTGEFLVSLIKGVKIRFYSKEFNPKKLLDLIDTYQISVFGGTPTLLSVMARFMKRKRTQHLKTICISGECMNKETGEYIANVFTKAKIYHVYGLTEAGPRISYLPPELFLENADSVGIALDSVFLKIVKKNSAEAGISEEGILWVKGSNVMSGYYNAPKQTEKVLKDGWLCTGDVASINEKGLLKIKGRSDDLIIRAGMNIYPQEVERELKKDSRVHDVLVYPIEKSSCDVQIGLKLSGAFESVDEIKKFCMEVLPSFQVPSVIELVDKIPRNASGKIIRKVV